MNEAYDQKRTRIQRHSLEVQMLQRHTAREEAQATGLPFLPRVTIYRVGTR